MGARAASRGPPRCGPWTRTPRLEQASPPEALVPGAPKECALSVHPDVSVSLGGTSGNRYELSGCHLPWPCYRTGPRFSTWLPPSREGSRLATFQQAGFFLTSCIGVGI